MCETKNNNEQKKCVHFKIGAELLKILTHEKENFTFDKLYKYCN